MKTRFNPSRLQGLSRAVGWAMAAWAAVMYALTFLHLLADFPYRSPWSDWAKTTDEGWYAGAALHHFVFGHWYLPDAFNTAVVLPAWPVMLGGWFAVAGVGMAQARVLALLLYGASLLLMVVLLREARCSWLACAGAVLLVIANPFCYVFDRLALLEPVMVFWWLLGLWLAGRVVSGGVWRAVVLGVLLVVLVWTKTTAVVLVVSILYFLGASAWARGLPWMRRGLIVVGTAGVLWVMYFVAWVRPRYMGDFRFLFAINAGRIHLRIAPSMALETLRGGLGVNAVLFPVALAVLVLSVAWWRRLWRAPLFASATIAMGLYLAFIFYHGNFQPRYYLVVAMPISIVVVMGVEEMWRRGLARVAVAVLCGLLVVAGVMTARTLEYVRHPAYSYRDMALSVARIMRTEGKAGVLLGGASDDISLYSGGVRGVDGYEPVGLEPILERYRPEWLGVWLEWERPIVQQSSATYVLQPVATFHVYDDEPFHRVFVLYRMTPRPQAGAEEKSGERR